jgi:hypothetical protein
VRRDDGGALAGLPVIAAAGLVVHPVDRRCLAEEGLRVPLRHVPGVHGGEVLGRGGLAELLEELGLPAREDADDGVVEPLPELEGIPVRGEDHAERPLVIGPEALEDALQPRRAEVLLHEAEPRLEHRALDLLHQPTS